MRSSKREQAVDAHHERSTVDVVLQPLLLSIPEVAPLEPYKSVRVD
jgi:hypothetical protein